MKKLAALLPLMLFLPRLALADGVALAVQLPDSVQPHHRAFAAGVTEQARKNWHVLMPPMAPEKITRCQSDVACLSAEAQTQNASHLVILGIAALGPNELVVSIRVLDLATQAEIFSFNEIKAVDSLGSAQQEGSKLAARQFSQVSGLPPPRAAAPPSDVPPPVDPDKAGSTSALAVVGWVLVGVGIPVSLGGFLATALFFDNANDNDSGILEKPSGNAEIRAAENYMFTGVGVGIAGGVLAITGLTLVALAPSGGE
jgi:hypothetical protein